MAHEPQLRGAVALFALSALALPGSADAKGAHRLAWAGLYRGSLAPARADVLESLLLDELDGYDSFRVVDAAGSGLDERLFAAEAARMSRLVDDGLDSLASRRTKQAVQKFDQAIEVFETKLTPLRDHELLHEALLAKATALLEGDKTGLALEALKALAALGPKKLPTAKTHPPKLVALFEQAVSELGLAGKIQLRAEEPGCQLFVDGKPLGKSPAEVAAIAPGRHYVVARWPFFVVTEAVQVAPGRELTVELERRGPAEEARTAIQAAIRDHAGPGAATGLAKRLADLSTSDDVLVGAVRGEGASLALVLARHDAAGRPTAVVRIPIIEAGDSQATSLAVRHATAALFVDRRTGELDVTPHGDAKAAPGLLEQLYGKLGGGVAAPMDLPADARAEAPRLTATATTSTSTTIAAFRFEEPAPAADRPVTGEWWFWAAVGAGVLAAGIGGAWLLSPSPSTTHLEVKLPAGGG